jgi:hypothetical protein
LESDIGAAPLSVALFESDIDDCHADGEKEFIARSDNPIVFPFLVNCKNCCAEGLLKVREQSNDPASKRGRLAAGSTSSALLPLLNASANAPHRIVAPWLVLGREVGRITIEGFFL